MADVLVVNKVDSAPPENTERVLGNIRSVRPGVPVVLGELEVTADRPDLITGKRVVVVEDGPTLTHGGMRTGAGTVAAKRHGAAQIVDVRPYAVGAIAEAFGDFPHLEGEVPAMGYSPKQIRDLEATLNAAAADAVIDATPVDLSRLMRLDKPLVDVTYAFRERGRELPPILERFEAERLRKDAVVRPAR
jgi:predicted GTPase